MQARTIIKKWWFIAEDLYEIRVRKTWPQETEKRKEESEEERVIVEVISQLLILTRSTVKEERQYETDRAEYIRSSSELSAEQQNLINEITSRREGLKIKREKLQSIKQIDKRKLWLKWIRPTTLALLSDPAFIHCNRHPSRTPTDWERKVRELYSL